MLRKLVIVSLGWALVHCVATPDLEVQRGEMMPEAAVLDVGGTELVGDGPVLHMRSLAVDPACDPTYGTPASWCFSDEEGYDPLLGTVTRSWNDFQGALATGGTDPGKAYLAVVGFGAVVALSDTPAPGPMDVAAVGAIVIGGVYVTVLVGQRLVEDPWVQERVDAVLTSVQTSVATALENVWFSARAGRWSCDASCNLEGSNSWCWNTRVSGSASGSSEPDACVEAKRVATQSAPSGCYARHCQCSCFRN